MERIYPGAGWVKESKDGKVFISLSIDLEKLAEVLDLNGEKTRLALQMFENTRKKNEKSPDYNVVYFVEDK